MDWPLRRTIEKKFRFIQSSGERLFHLKFMLIGHLFSAVSHQFASKPPSCTFFLSRVWLGRDSPLESNRERTDRQAGCLLKVGYRWERYHLTGKHRKRFKYIYIWIKLVVYICIYTTSFIHKGHLFICFHHQKWNFMRFHLFIYFHLST